MIRWKIGKGMQNILMSTNFITGSKRFLRAYIGRNQKAPFVLARSYHD